MVCPKCGANNNSYFCIRCGYVNKEDTEYKVFNETYPVEDIELFIGNNQEHIINKPSNYAAGLFGGLYYLYRKMYLFGIILVIFDLIYLYKVLLTLNLSWISLLLLLKMFIYIIFTNPIYLYFSKRKINKIKQMEDYDVKYLTYNGGVDIDTPIIALTGIVIAVTTFIITIII